MKGCLIMANKIPTLIIGIGGIGCNIVAETFKSLDAEDKKTIATVCMDTDANDLKRYQELGVDAVIQTSTNDVVGDILAKPENKGMTEWFQTNPLLNEKSMLEGAGQIRQSSRLAMLACINADKFGALEQAIDKLNQAGALYPQSMKIFIVGSIAGGTGAGMMVQLPFYLRKLIGKKKHVLIRGLFLTPDVCESVQGYNPIKIASIYSNAYACIKEINACNENAFREASDIPIDIECYEKGRAADGVNTNMIPYDFIFLIGRKNLNDRIFGNGYLTNYFDMAKNILRTQLTQIGSKLYSAEDNLILGHIDAHGMDRYCGAGAVEVRYPLDAITKYCALRWAKDIIQNQWEKMDNMCQDKKEVDREEQVKDPFYIPADEATSYVSIFEELANPETQNRFFSQLNAELSLGYDIREIKEDGFERNIAYNKIQKLMDAIDQFIEQSANTEAITNAKLDCYHMNVDTIVNAETGAVISYELEKVENYKKLIMMNRSTIYAASERILSVSPRIKGHADNRDADRDYNIFSLIKGLHPITARYALYKIKKELLNKLERVSPDLFETSRGLNLLIEKDFDDELPGVQTAEVVYSQLRRETETNLLQKAKAVFKNNKNELEEFADKFMRTVQEQIDVLARYNVANYRVRVYQSVLEKIDELLFTYKTFFESLDKVEDEIKEKVTMQEGMHEFQGKGIRYVFADSTCKKVAYEMVKKSTDFNENTLSEDTKMQFAEDLYEIFVNFYSQSRAVSAQEKVQLKSDIIEANAPQLFKESIQKSLEHEMRSNAGKILDIGVLRGLEYEILYQQISDHKKIKNSDVDHGILNRFMRGIDTYSEQDIKTDFDIEIMKIINRAAPFVRLENNPREQLLYWGVNPGIVPVDANGEPDRARIQARLDAGSFKSTGVITDRDFTRNELICYRSVYAAKVEELTLFNKTSDARKYYDYIVDQAINAHDGSVLTPHLDKRWYKEAYLPAIDPKEEAEERDARYLAFVFLLLLDHTVELTEYDGVKRWTYINDLISYDIKLDEDNAPGNLKGLLRSMSYNAQIKRDIMERVSKIEQKEMENSSIIEDEILKHEIIQKFVDIGDIASEGDPDIHTIFDFIVVYSNILSKDKSQEMREAVRGYLRRYADKMGNRQEQRDKLYKDIIRYIFDNSNDITKANAEIKGILPNKSN